ncbi:MAG TPA: asparagine synthase (glutamine-hydrolyzing) [Polyangiaceae bacterium]
MCGIAGLLGIDLALARPAAERMQAALRHRGPDDRGLEIVERAGSHPALLVHTRLSIVELSSAGHQPMRDHPPAGRAPNLVTFNGEIYNFGELHADLAEAGWPCRTRSDTEVILNGYRAWGTRAVERFEGMFAFCLLDVEAGQAWLCRDRVGIKPLYVARPASGGLLFASEVRALLAAGPELLPRRLHRPALESFFAQGAVMSEASLVEGVELVPPGESWSFDFAGKLRERRRYWSVSFGTGAEGGPGPARFRSEVVAELGLALRRSLKKQLIADVPVGLFLSAGIDSSAIATLASEVSNQPLRTIAIGFDVAELDETAGAELTARALGTRHERVELGGRDVLASFDQVLGAADQPTVDGFNTFYVSRAARQAGLTVALSGLGGDELFGGYRSFLDVPRGLRLARLGGAPTTRRGALLRAALRRAARLPALRGKSRALFKASEALARPAAAIQAYYLRRELFSPAERRALQVLPDGCDPYSGIATVALARLEDALDAHTLPDRIAELEYSSYMRHMLLRDADVFSMAHGLELRVPLLEHDAVAEAARAQGRWRLPDPRPKPLLVDAAGPRLPAHCWREKKRGFTFPWSAWLEGPLAERARSGLFEGSWGGLGVDAAAVRRVWSSFAAGDARVSPLAVLALVVLEAYAREHRLTA